MSDIDTKMTLGEVVARHPAAAAVFERAKLDYCCGGQQTLEAACAQKGVQIDELLRSIDEAEEQARTRDADRQNNWLESSLTDLCDHIEQTHHAYLKTELPRLTELVAKVVSAHGANHEELASVQQVYAGLRAELEPHMMKEERILFPAIRQLEQASSTEQLAFPFGTVANPIRMMEHEHDIAGRALEQLRALTNDYSLPEDACNTYRVLFDALQTLETDLHQHIHKENNILFPRAQQLEAGVPAS